MGTQRPFLEVQDPMYAWALGWGVCGSVVEGTLPCWPSQLFHLYPGVSLLHPFRSLLTNTFCGAGNACGEASLALLPSSRVSLSKFLSFSYLSLKEPLAQLNGV